MEERCVPRQGLQQLEDCASVGTSRRLQLDDEGSAFSCRSKVPDVDADRDDSVLALEAIARSRCGLGGRGEQRVDSCTETVAA